MIPRLAQVKDNKAGLRNKLVTRAYGKTIQSGIIVVGVLNGQL